MPAGKVAASERSCLPTSLQLSCTELSSAESSSKVGWYALCVGEDEERLSTTAAALSLQFIVSAAVTGCVFLPVLAVVRSCNCRFLDSVFSGSQLTAQLHALLRERAPLCGIVAYGNPTGCRGCAHILCPAAVCYCVTRTPQSLASLVLCFPLVSLWLTSLKCSSLSETCYAPFVLAICKESWQVLSLC